MSSSAWGSIVCIFMLYALILKLFQAICAKADGEPCCDWVGEDGSGHFVKMVHNGIEYGDMQLICEAYNLMKDALGKCSGWHLPVLKSG